MELKRSMPVLACLFFFVANLAATHAAGDSTSPRIRATNMTAFGVASPIRPVVWYSDPDFQTLLAPRSPLQLIDRQKLNCSDKCEACNYTWKATREDRKVALFFKDPVLISRIYIKQVRNSGVVAVQLLKWVYPPAGAVNANTLGRTVWNVTDDTSMCQSVLVVRRTDKQAGVNKPVPAGGSQENLPASLAKVAVGGVVITMKIPADAGDNFGPFVEYVRFAGLVLYPSDPSIYEPPINGR